MVNRGKDLDPYSRVKQMLEEREATRSPSPVPPALAL